MLSASGIPIGGATSGPDPALGQALMEPSEVARVFEERLAEALLGEWGW